VGGKKGLFTGFHKKKSRVQKKGRRYKSFKGGREELGRKKGGPREGAFKHAKNLKVAILLRKEGRRREGMGIKGTGENADRKGGFN